MKADYTPHLRPRGESTLRCGRCDCAYYTRETDSCDYLLLEYRPRGCPPTADCARYRPGGEEQARRLRRLALEMRARD